MRRDVTGSYEVTTVAGEQIRAFVPYPLSSNPPLELTYPRQQLLERATLALGRLDSITLLLPDPDLFLYAYVQQRGLEPLQQEQMVLQYVDKHGRITRREAAELCRIGPFQASRLPARLVEDGRLVRHGVRKAAWYERRQNL